MGDEIRRIKATFKANPVTDMNDARCARISALNRTVREQSEYIPGKLVGGKAKDQSRYFKPPQAGRRRLVTNMGGEMATRVKINQLKDEIRRIKATFKANPVTDMNDARCARISALNRTVREQSEYIPGKLVGGKAKDQSRYFK